jgi:uncharacterized protein (DUF1697 family)
MKRHTTPFISLPASLAGEGLGVRGAAPDAVRDPAMPVFITLLRATNVGGTGKLPMSDLRSLCEKAGFRNVRTYIASGNVVAERDGSEAEAKAALEAELGAYAGKPIGVIVRTGAEMSKVVANNPFPNRSASRTVAIFLDLAPPPDVLKDVKGQANEELRLGAREIYVHYPDGIGRSKLRIPTAGDGTARNMNTVAKLATMAAE